MLEMSLRVAERLVPVRSGGFFGNGSVENQHVLPSDCQIHALLIKHTPLPHFLQSKK